MLSYNRESDSSTHADGFHLAGTEWRPGPIGSRVELIRLYRQLVQQYRAAQTSIAKDEFRADYKGSKSSPFPPIDIDIARALEVARYSSNVHVQQFLSGADRRGVLHPSQIETLIAILRMLYTQDYPIGVVIGPTNCGKTGTMQAAKWFAIQHYLLTDQPAVILYLLPNNLKLYDQSAKAAVQHNALYGEIEFVSRAKPKNRMTYGHQDRLEWEFAKRVKNVLQNSGHTVDVQNVLRPRLNKAHLPWIEAVLDCAAQQKYAVIMIHDEVHAQDTPRGPLSEIWRAIERKVLRGLDVRVVGFSATPYVFGDALKTKPWEVRHRLSPSYVGVNTYAGTPIDSRYVIKPPTTFTLYEFSKRLGIPEIAWVSRRAYHDRSKLDKRFIEKHGVPFKYHKHDAYCMMVRKTIAAVISKLLAKHDAKKDVNPQAGRGMIIRWSKDNISLDDLIAKLEPGLKKAFGGDIALLAYTRKQTESIRDFISQIDKSRYVIFVTGAGRMGDDVPDDMTYFLDFTDDVTTTAALIQGLPGRACGHNRRSWVVMHQRNIETLRLYFSTGEFIKRPNHSMFFAAKLGRPPKDVAMDIRISRGDCPKLFDQIEKILDDKEVSFEWVKPSPKQKQQGRPGRIQVLVNGELRQNVARFLPVEKLFPILEKLRKSGEGPFRSMPDAQILIPGETTRRNGELCGYTKGERWGFPGQIEVGFRTIGVEGQSGDSLDATRVGQDDTRRPDRSETATTLKAKKVSLHPQLRVSYKTKRVENILFPLKAPAQILRQGTPIEDTQINPGKIANPGFMHASARRKAYRDLAEK